MKTRSGDGRVFVRVPENERHLHPTIYKDGYILRYVYVWNTAHPDSPVQRGEIIHHINEDPSDDRLDNLEKTVQARHAAYHSAGRTMSPEARTKISKSQRERIARDGYHWVGRRHTEASRELMRQKQRARRARERSEG